MDLLPAIDLRLGRVVRLREGDDTQRSTYDLEPLAVLETLARAGIRRVHVVDLDAAFGEAPQRELVATLVASGLAAIQLGGGLRDEEAVAAALELGCERAVLGSLVVQAPERFESLARRFPGRLVPALEVRDRELRVAGWREGSTATLRETCARLRGLPCPAVLVTDIARDGLLVGPNLDLAVVVARASGLRALVSGGVRAIEDLAAAAMRPEIAGAVVGRALYEGSFSVAAAREACGTTALARRVIPCLDVAAGRVVKGVRFADLRDAGDPAECARRYAEQGADEIVFLDITAAPERRATDLSWVERAAGELALPLTVGGGVRSVAEARALLLSGADKVGVNTAAVGRPALVGELAERFGSQCVVLAVDARRLGRESTAAPLAWDVVTHGGRRPANRDALGWIAEAVSRGAGEILLTSMDGDGTLAGYDLELLAAVVNVVRVPVIAAGGAGQPEHFAAALLAGASAVLAASVFHDGTYSVGQIKKFLGERGFPVREEAA
jgi:imidazole glycerol-phosphate synthase subunit HisF